MEPDGTVWIGTDGKGLRPIRRRPVPQDGRRETACRPVSAASFSPTRGGVLVGTDRGLYRSREGARPTRGEREPVPGRPLDRFGRRGGRRSLGRDVVLAVPGSGRRHRGTARHGERPRRGEHDGRVDASRRCRTAASPSAWREASPSSTSRGRAAAVRPLRRSRSRARSTRGAARSAAAPCPTELRRSPWPSGRRRSSPRSGPSSRSGCCRSRPTSLRPTPKPGSVTPVSLRGATPSKRRPSQRRASGARGPSASTSSSIRRGGGPPGRRRGRLSSSSRGPSRSCACERGASAGEPGSWRPGSRSGRGS